MIVIVCKICATRRRNGNLARINRNNIRLAGENNAREDVTSNLKNRIIELSYGRLDNHSISEWLMLLYY